MSLFSKLFGKKGGGTTVPSPLASSANEIINNTINNSKTITTMTQQEIMAIAAAVANILNGNNNQSATTVITTLVETAPSTQSTPSTESTNSTPSTESTISTKELNYCIYSTLEGKPYNYAFYGEALAEDAINAIFKAVIGDKAKVGKHKGNLKSIGEGTTGWRISVKNIEKSSYKTLDGVLNALNAASPITLVERESVASVSDARREEQAKAKEAEKKEDVVPEQEAEKKAIKDAEKAKAKDESRKTKDEGRKKKDEGKKEEPTSAPAQTVSLVTDLSAWDSTTLKVVCYDASKEEPVIRIETEVQKCPSCKNLYFRKDENGKYRIYAHAGNSQLYLIGITSADIPAGAPLGAKAETWEFIGNNGLVKAITTEVQKSVKPHMVAAYENSGKEDVYQWLKGLAA